MRNQPDGRPGDHLMLKAFRDQDLILDGLVTIAIRILLNIN
jgi:hypothetical protein